MFTSTQFVLLYFGILIIKEMLGTEALEHTFSSLLLGILRFIELCDPLNAYFISLTKYQTLSQDIFKNEIISS
jgi:hypothetical protein